MTTVKRLQVIVYKHMLYIFSKQIVTMHKCERCGEETPHKYCKSCYKKERSMNRCIICETIVATKKELYCKTCRPFNKWAHTRIAHKKGLGIKINFSAKWLTKKAHDTTHCELCGKELVYNAEGSYANFASLDRINNDEILTEDNTWIVCYQCNTTKSNRTLEEFLDYCKRITERWRI